MSGLAQVENLSKRFGSHIGVDELSFELAEGSVVGLLGLNAAGKSTCLKLMAGLLTPSAGGIKVLGRKPRLQRHFIAYMSEKDTLYEWLNVKSATRLMKGLFPDFREDRFYELVSMLDVPLHTVKAMSKGQRTRLRLAMTLARKARLFLLDEPLSGIDLISREQILHALIYEWREDATVMLSTHELLEAEKMLDRVLLLKEGRLVLDTTPQDLSSQGQTVVDSFKEILA